MARKCDWLLGHDWAYSGPLRRRCVRCDRRERGVGYYESRNLLLPFLVVGRGVQWERNDDLA